MSPIFFLSYSRTNPSGFIEQFYKDLVAQVRSNEGISNSVPDEEIGFYDKESIALGAEWPATLSRALSECRTMVCLYAKGYFQSEVCGKEAQAFLLRCHAWRQANSEEPLPPLLLPVLWGLPGAPSAIPDVLSGIQFTSGTEDDLYRKRGLQYMQGQQKSGDAYREFVFKLAEAITGQAADPLAAHRTIPPLAETPSAFAPPPGAPAPAPRGGPNVMQFAYFAGADADYHDIRTERGGYPPPPPDPRLWKPFAPAEPREIRQIAQEIVFTNRWTYEDLTVDGDFIKNVEAAAGANRIVILVIDPWSVRVSTLKATMEKWKSARARAGAPELLKNCGVLIPWNFEDAETIQHEDTLRLDLQRTFAVNPYFQRDPRSAKEFEQQLIETVEQVRQKLLRDAVSVRRAGVVPVPMATLDATRTI